MGYRGIGRSGQWLFQETCNLGHLRRSFPTFCFCSHNCAVEKLVKTGTGILEAEKVLQKIHFFFFFWISGGGRLTRCGIKVKDLL